MTHPLLARAASIGLTPEPRHFEPVPLPAGFVKFSSYAGPFHKVAFEALDRMTGDDGNPERPSAQEVVRLISLISLDGTASLYFACRIGRRFLPGEEAISIMGGIAVEYAKRFLKGRFLAAEFAIHASGFRTIREYSEHLAACGMNLAECVLLPDTVEALGIWSRWSALPWEVRSRVHADGIGLDTIESLEAEACAMRGRPRSVGVQEDEDAAAHDDAEDADGEEEGVVHAPLRSTVKPAGAKVQGKASPVAEQLDLFAA